MPPSSPIPHEKYIEYDTPTRKGIRDDRFRHSIPIKSISNTRNILILTI